jgi:thioredoxin 1
MSSTKAVTDDTFADDVLRSDKPVVVDFWAPWCAPCRLVAPILEEIAGEHADRLSVFSINADENPQTTATYGVTAMPTINVYVGGQVVRSIVGAKPKRLLLRELEEWIG